MGDFFIRTASVEHDFGQLAALFTSQEDEVTTESSLLEYYEKNKDRIIHRVVDDNQGHLLGFYWAARDRVDPQLFYISLIVRPEYQHQGFGGRLYAHLEREISQAQAHKLRVSIRDTCPSCREFAERRGFSEIRHLMGMELNLETFDDKPFDAIISHLKEAGFQFTSMEELGNTEEAQRKLFALNDTASASTPGTDGEHSWASFEDFQKSVCQSDWYKPGGQMVVIDRVSGSWAAMSAITRFEGTEFAYNLFTGVDYSYRGCKLAQAVKVLALRYARQELNVNTVRTHHNTKNLPMIAIDRKLGYVQIPGSILMQKVLE